MAYIYAEKPTGWFMTTAQARQHFDEKLLRELGESMGVKQLQPVGARPDGQLLWGERRLRAAKLVGLPSLLTLICDEPMSESDAKIITLTENIQREDLTPFETWQAAAELLRLNIGWSKRDLAGHLKKDPSMITRILSPSDCVDAVIASLKAGDIGFKAVYEISKVPQEAQQALLDAALASGADGVAKARRKTTGTVPAIRVNRCKFARPSGNVVTLAGEDMSLEEAANELSELAAEMRKADKGGISIKTFMANCRDRAEAGA